MSPTFLGNRWKHITMKPKKSGSEYYNYKDFFSLVLLALVDAECRLLLVDVGSNGCSSDAQNFKQTKLREMIKDGTLGLLPPESLVEGEHICTISCWVTTSLP